MRERLELVVAGLLTACAAALHLLFYRSAGPLWRDEIVSLHVATSPHLFDALQFDSFPILWLSILRLFPAAPRLLGALTGPAVIAALWIAARTLGSRTPLIALAIVALNGNVVRYGDSLRAYGASIVIGLLSLAALHAAATRPSPRAWIIAAIAAIVSVQTSFHNAVLLFAACIAAALVARSVMPLAAGFVAALSLLVYLPMMRERAQWSSIETFGVDFEWIGRRAVEAFGPIALLAVVLAAILGYRNRFAMTALFVFAAGQLVFLRVLRYAPQPWYFVLLIAAAGVCADALLTNVPLRIGIAVVVAAVSLPRAISDAATRASNFDRIAAATSSLSKPGDVVIVYPWYCGVSYNVYQRGTRWMTLPPIEDQSLQRYDLLLPKLGRADAATPVIKAATTALRGGHRVWLAGFPLCSESAGSLGDPRTATPNVRADAVWCGALRDVLRNESGRAARVIAPDPRVSIYERAQLIAFERTAR
jgi:hypothetical protein